MLKQTSAVALLLTTFSIAVALSPGCGGGTSRPEGTAGAGGGTAGSGTAGAGTAGAGTAGAGTAGEGTAGAGTAGAGTAGAGTAGAGTAGVDGGSAGAGTAGAGTAGAGTAGAQPPPITATTTVLEVDDVFVTLKSTGSDGGVDGAADGGSDGAVADGSVDAISSADGGVDGAADGGSDAPAGPPSVGVSYTFDTSAVGLDGWHFTPYGSTDPNAPADPANLALSGTLAWSGTDDADGHSNSGVIKGTVLFKHQGDQIDFQAFTQNTGKYNWTGFTISAKVKLVSGGNLAYGCPLTAALYVSDAAGYRTRLSGTVNLVAGGWVTITFDMADATTAGSDVTNINQMGLQINTGPACVGTTPPDAGTDTAPTDGGTTDAPVDAPASDVAADTAAGN